MRVRVATWNVHGCVGADRSYDPERVAAVIAALDADVIGLQEVDWRRPALEGRDALAHLAHRLGLRAVEGPNLHDRRGAYGNGLLSRFPVEAERRVALAQGRREPRGAIDATLATPDGLLRALVTHLGLRRGERLRQAARLAAAVATGADAALPTVLLGDLNEWRPARLAPPLLVPDPFPAQAAVRSWPAWRPLFALDRVLARPAPARIRIECVDTVAARAASDHLPVIATIEW